MARFEVTHDEENVWETLRVLDSDRKVLLKVENCTDGLHIGIALTKANSIEGFDMVRFLERYEAERFNEWRTDCCGERIVFSVHEGQVVVLCRGCGRLVVASCLQNIGGVYMPICNTIGSFEAEGTVTSDG